MDICETEGVIMKIKDYYKLSSNAAVILQKYSETWSAWIDIKVEDICDQDKINVIVLEQNTDNEKSIDKSLVSNIQVIAYDWYESSSSL